MMSDDKKHLVPDQRSRLLEEEARDPEIFLSVASQRVPWYVLFAKQHPNIAQFLSSSLSSLYTMLSSDSLYSCRPDVEVATLFVDPTFEGVRFLDPSGAVHSIPMTLQTFHDWEFPSDTWTSWVPEVGAAETEYFNSLIPSDLPPDTSVHPFPLNGSSPAELAGQKLFVDFTPGPTQLGAMMRGFVLVELAFNHLPWLWRSFRKLTSSSRDDDRKKADWGSFIYKILLRSATTLTGAITSTALSVVAVRMLSSHLPSVGLRVMLFLSVSTSNLIGRKLSRSLLAASKSEVKQ